jgi:2-C-methyl-D-erythritol 2,4-cyclodiphosphate synthase
MSDVTTALAGLRVAQGIDVHPLVEGRRLILAGVEVPSDRGLDGHSDGDVVAHAVTDAVLGCMGAGDIGERFPSDDASLEGADSMKLLAQVVEDAVSSGMTILNVDVVVALQAPRLAPHRESMRARLADVLGIDADRVTVRATTTDHLGTIGRGEGAAAFVSCLAHLQ